MTRSINTDLAAQLALKRGASPRNLVEFGFSTPLRVSDQHLVIDDSGTPVEFMPLVREWGFVDSSAGQIPGSSIIGRIESPDLNLVLDNTASPRLSDGFDPLDPLEGVEVSMSQWCVGLEYSSRETVFLGMIGGQPEYNEDTCRLHIKGIWQKYNRLIGSDLLISEDNYPGCAPAHVGVMANIAYGRLRDIPARAVDAGSVDNLAAAVTASQTTISLSDASKFPVSGTAGIGGETFSYTGKSGNDLTGCSARNTTYGPGEVVFEIQQYYVYQIASHPVDHVSDVTVDGFIITSVSLLYTGQSGDSYNGYSGQAVAVIPAAISRSQAETLLQDNGLSAADSADAVATIPGTGDVTVSDTVSLFNAMGVVDQTGVKDTITVSQGSHSHGGDSGIFLLSFDSAYAYAGAPDFPWNLCNNNWNDACVLYKSPDQARGQVGRYKSGPGTIVNYRVCAHFGFVGQNTLGSFGVVGNGPTIAFDAAANLQTIKSAWYPAGTAFDTWDKINAAEVFCLVSQAGASTCKCSDVWIEVQYSQTVSASPAYGVVKGGAAEKTGTVVVTRSASSTRGASRSGAIARGGTVTRTGAVGLTSDHVAGVEVGKTITADFTGWRDDGAGSVTGTPYALIERPAHVVRHILQTYCAFPSASIASSFAAAAAWQTVNNYTFSFIINQIIRADELLRHLALQSRTRIFVTPAGIAQMIVREFNRDQDHAVTVDDIVRGSMSVRRSAAADIVNTIPIKWDRNWSRPAGDDAYHACKSITDTGSVSRYGIRDPADPELFAFDAVTDAVMAADVADYWLDLLRDSRRQPTFSVYLDHFVIEGGDVVGISHYLGNMVRFPCEVLKLRHVPGSARRGTMDRIEITAVENVRDVTQLRLGIYYGRSLASGGTLAGSVLIIPGRSLASGGTLAGSVMVIPGRSLASGGTLAGSVMVIPGRSLASGNPVVMYGFLDPDTGRSLASGKTVNMYGWLVPSAGRSATSGGSMSSSLYLVDYFSGGLVKQLSCANDLYLDADAPTLAYDGVAVNHLTGDVYVSVSGGDIYRQAGGTGAFTAMGQVSRSWIAMDINWHTGDVYACVPGDGIYCQTGGVGDFVSIFASALSWQGIAVDQRTGDVYACVSGGDIYRQAGGLGSFVALGQTARAWNTMTCHPYTGEIYAAVYQGYIYRRSSAGGDFTIIPTSNVDYWTGLAVNPDNGDFYAVTYGGDIYRLIPGGQYFQAIPQTWIALGQIAIG